MGIGGQDLSSNAGISKSRVTSSNLVLKRGIAYVGTALTSQNYTTPAAIPFNSELEDTDGFHSTVSNTSRLTIPSGVTRVQLSASVWLQAVTSGNPSLIEFYKNGSAFTGVGASKTMQDITFSQRRMRIKTAPITVTEGDYFEVFLEQKTDTSITIDDSQTWFMVEEVI